jgi:hypothetical protein
MMLLVAMATQFASAKPGQTEKQLVAWGKSNPLLMGFHKTFDQNTAGNDYQAKVVIGQYHADFSSEPVNGVVPREYLSFNDMPEKTNLATKWDFNARAFAALYGAAIEADVLHPIKSFATRSVSIHLGKYYTYAAIDTDIVIAPISKYAWYVSQAKSCDSLDCAGD